jgi:hypothetical protein
VVVVEVVVLGEPHTEDSGRLLCATSQCMAMCGGGCGSRRTTYRRLGTTFVSELAMYGNVW